MIDTESIQKETKLEKIEFENLFNEILLSEVIKYYDNSDYLENTIKGISFFGKEISIDKYIEYNNILRKNNLRLLMSCKTMTRRWNDFTFPDFKNIETLIDIDKQCYHVIEYIENRELLKYIYSYYSDRIKFNSITNKWLEKHGLEVVWNDYSDIVVLFNKLDCIETEIFEDVKELLDYKISNEISNDERYNSVFEYWPIIHLYLK